MIAGAVHELNGKHIEKFREMTHPVLMHVEELREERGKISEVGWIGGVGSVSKP